MKRLLLVLILLCAPALGAAQLGLPTSTDQIFETTDTNTGSFTDSGLESVTAPTSDGFETVANQGTYQFRFLVERVINVIKWFLIPIAVILLGIRGLSVMGARTDTQQVETAKEELRGMALGFGVITFSIVLVDNIFLSGFTDVEQTGRVLNLQIQGFFNFGSGLAVGVAVFFLVLGAYQLLFSQGTDDALDAARQRVTMSIMGIAVIMVARAVYSIVTNSKGQLTSPNAGGIIALLGGWTNFLMAAVAFAALLGLIYGGVQLIVGFGNEQNQTTARSIVIGSIVALVLTLSAYAIVAFVSGAFA